MKRDELITQLRLALNVAESPQNDVVEFEIGSSAFCFEFGDESKKDTPKLVWQPPQEIADLLGIPINYVWSTHSQAVWDEPSVTEWISVPLSTVYNPEFRD